MLFQLSVGFVLTARDFSPGFAVFSPHYLTLPKFPFYRVRTLVISVGLARYIFNVFGSIYLFVVMSWLATENFSCQWLQNKHFPIPVLPGTQELSLSEVFRALAIFGGVNNVHFYCLYVCLFDYRDSWLPEEGMVRTRWEKFSFFPFFKWINLFFSREQQSHWDQSSQALSSCGLNYIFLIFRFRRLDAEFTRYEKEEAEGGMDFISSCLLQPRILLCAVSCTPIVYVRKKVRIYLGF